MYTTSHAPGGLCSTLLQQLGKRTSKADERGARHYDKNFLGISAKMPSKFPVSIYDDTHRKYQLASLLLLIFFKSNFRFSCCFNVRKNDTETKLNALLSNRKVYFLKGRPSHESLVLCVKYETLYKAQYMFQGKIFTLRQQLYNS